MKGSLLRVALVAGTLLRQNRLLIVLLLLWPFALSGVLLAVAHGSPAVEDVAAILQQELFYGLVLAALGASAALGNEQRAHRMQQVLGRAVSRAEYLLALGGSAYLPFAGDVLVWLANALALAGLLHRHTPMLLPPFVAELGAGLLLCATGLLCSVLLPRMVATLATALALGTLLAAGMHGFGGVAGLFAIVAGGGGAMGAPWLDAGQALLFSALLGIVAAVVFERRDLKLN